MEITILLGLDSSLDCLKAIKVVIGTIFPYKKANTFFQGINGE